MSNFSNLLAIILLSVALMLNQGELYVIISILLVLKNSVYIVPLLIYYPIVGSALDEFSILPTELSFAGFMIPYLILNIKHVVKSKSNLLFIYAFIIGILGYVVAILQKDPYSNTNSIFFSNLIVLIKIIYYYLLFLFLSSKSLSFYTDMLKVMKIQFPVFIIVLFLYISLFGKVYGEGYLSEYINFGIGTHGYYGTMLALISSVFFFNLIESKNVFYMIFLGFILVLTLYLIIISGSRNGFASFLFINFLTFILVKGIRFWSTILFSVLMIVFLVFLDNLEHNPVLNRSIDSEDVSSGRFDLWKGALEGFFEFPLTGIGNNKKFEMRYLEKTVDIGNVTHNTFIQFALVYGIHGVILFFTMGYLSIKGFFITKVFCKKQLVSKALLLPYLMFFSVIFSSNFVSWAWDSIVWYPFILALSLTASHKLNFNYAYS